MNKQEYRKKYEEIQSKIQVLREKERKLREAYAAYIQKLNGLKSCDILVGSDGKEYSFAKVVFDWRPEARGYKLKKDGTPGGSLVTIYGFRLKEDEK